MRSKSKISLVVTILSVALSSCLAVAVSSVDAAPPRVTISEGAETIAIVPDTTLTNSDGESLTKELNLSITVSGATNGGIVTPFVNSVPQDPVTMPATVPIVLTKLGRNVVNVRYTYTVAGKAKTLTSNSVIVELDTIGPRLEHAEVVEVPSTGTTLIVAFAQDDFQTTTIPINAFAIGRKNLAGNFTTETFSPQSAIIQGRTIRLPFSALPSGDYQLTVKGDGTLIDKAGNRAGGSGNVGVNMTWLFSVLSDRKFGKHVEFTPYAPPTKQPIPQDGFNPGDFVETRVARLFYFRDAHRVAQIVNRNIRSFNEAAVTLAERRAESSRDGADDATDERREKERTAVRNAEQARNAEQQLAQAQQKLAKSQSLKNANAAFQERVKEIDRRLKDPTITPTDKSRLEAEREQLQQNTAKNAGELALYGDMSELSKMVVSMQQSVANLRQAELVAKDAFDNAEAIEVRARAKQFRDEVTAAETDPDTYVAGDINSVDPVTQCSLSVIGEGLIQIRGPIKGINKIRTMINQIDSPVGQIKIGVFTVQVNGEQGDKMEKVAGDAEGAIDLSRFLVNQSLNLLRRSIQTEAAMIAEQCDLEGHYQVDRDRRYLYSFFGRDFIDELYEMNSEFMFTENKLLSLHAMDTISFNRAMFILALAKNDVRERIVTRFLESTKTELADAEFDFRRSSELKPHQTEKHVPFWNRTHLPVKNHYQKEEVIYEAVHRNALQRYHFRNFSGFFDTGFISADTMNPMQREFIRMAQIFKARLIAEMEWKQRVLERGLIEDRSNDERKRTEILQSVHREALEKMRIGYQALLASISDFAALDAVVSQVRNVNDRIVAEKDRVSLLQTATNNLGDSQKQAYISSLTDLHYFIEQIVNAPTQWVSDAHQTRLLESLSQLKKAISSRDPDDFSVGELQTAFKLLKAIEEEYHNPYKQLQAAIEDLGRHVRARDTTLPALNRSFNNVLIALDRPSIANSTLGKDLRTTAYTVYSNKKSSLQIEETISSIEDFLDQTRGPLDHRKLLDHLIDQQEEKYIELVEGTRSHIAVMDQYLKRLSIALEDDFKVQYYDPAFIRVREAARGEAVNLSQVERTTILTNNRAFAKVDPQATMEFDLPKRQIAIKEAFDAAKALVEDTGALVNDPTFLSAFQMMGGAAQPSTVKNVIPGQSMSTDQHIMGLVPPPPAESSPGSALQSLVPEPAIYKLETGTGFQLRPVMQPDGDSAVYDFDYMYTTNIREPVRADEKHVGRIKRHFVHTAVQTGNFELREISRYQVALKVSRTGQGVPLLQDIPLLGRVFRPAPSAESSLQQNIIFGQTNLYPTLFDLMGLRWAQQVVDLDHTSLLASEHVIRGRQKSMRDYVFHVASERVDEFLDVSKKASTSYRPDFYHEQSRPSPYHPGGSYYPGGVQDPTGNNFERTDRRPPEMQDPPYDRYRHRPVSPERIGPQLITPEPVPVQMEPSIDSTGRRGVEFGQPLQEVSEFRTLLRRGSAADDPKDANSIQLEGPESDYTSQMPSARWRPTTRNSDEPLSQNSLQPLTTMANLRPISRDVDIPKSRQYSEIIQANYEKQTIETSMNRVIRLPPVTQ